MRKFTRLTAVFLLLSLIFTGCGGQARTASASAGDLKINTDAPVDGEIRSLLDEAARLWQTHGPDSGRIWPGYDLEKNDMIVCLREDGSNAVTHAWRISTCGMEALTAEQLKAVEIPAAGGYSSLTFEGRKGIILSLSRDSLASLEKVEILNFIYEIGVHEMVHFHYESMLKLMELGMEQKRHGGRGTAFPKAAEPRVYRKMLYDSLVAAFDNPGEEETYLGRAKYWNEKWKKEFPEEYYQAKVTDIMEGKARYIQYMMCMPRDLDEAEQAAWISQRFDRSSEPAVSMDSESYKLGFAAGVLLDRRGTGWKEQMTKKPEPPVEILLKNVETAVDASETYEKFLAVSREQMAQVNEELEGKLAGIRAAEADTGIPLLKLDAKYMAGSFETSDFLNLDGKSLVVDFGATFESRNGRAVVSGLSVYEPGKAYLLPLTMPYELRGGRLVIECEEAVCDIQVKQTVDGDGRTVYVMQ